MDSYWSRIVSRVLAIDPGIRYVGIVDLQYRVIASEMRAGLVSLTTSETDRIFISIVPLSMVEGARKLEPSCGPLEIMTVRYRKVVLAIYRAGQHIIVLSYDPSIKTPFTAKLTDQLRKIFQYDKTLDG